MSFRLTNSVPIIVYCDLFSKNHIDSKQDEQGSPEKLLKIGSSIPLAQGHFVLTLC